MTYGDNWVSSSGSGIYPTYGYTCGGCNQWVTYNGHICSGGLTTYTASWLSCPNCHVYYVSGTFHSCAQMLENKPKYEEHTLECGCKVKTVVTEHCETLHQAPEDDSKE